MLATPAADGREALDLLSESYYHAGVRDLGMPHINGLELCRRLRGG